MRMQRAFPEARVMVSENTDADRDAENCMEPWPTAKQLPACIW
jgi:hypothetical protein